MKTAIFACLPEDYPWKALLCYEPVLESTNDLLKTLARQGAPHGTAVIAGQQTGGHGRMGRSFHSPAGQGLYLSLLLRPRCDARALMHLTCAAAVAACDAVEQAADFRPGIKWTNDLVWKKRKLGGILTELGFAPDGTVAYAIIGIGINCLQSPEDFPPEISAIAGSLTMAAGMSVPTAAVAAALLDALQKMDKTLLTGKTRILERYRRDCITPGQMVSVVRGDTVEHGRALDIDDDGGLVVRYCDGRVETVNSGEVSIRGMYGYV